MSIRTQTNSVLFHCFLLLSVVVVPLFVLYWQRTIIVDAVERQLLWYKTGAIIRNSWQTARIRVVVADVSIRRQPHRSAGHSANIFESEYFTRLRFDSPGRLKIVRKFSYFCISRCFIFYVFYCILYARAQQNYVVQADTIKQHNIAVILQY